MDRRRTPARRAGLVAAIALLLPVGLAACSHPRNTLVGKAPVAVVGDDEISRAELDEAIEVDKAIAAFVSKHPGTESIISAGTTSFAELDSDSAALPAAGVAASLTQLIQKHLIDQAADQERSKVDAKKSEAREAFTSELQQASVDVKDLPKAYVDQQVELRALQLALIAAQPTDTAALQKAYEEQKNQYANTCVNVIATTSEAPARTAFERLSAGEDFKVVSDDLNEDPQLKESRGEAGCGAAADLAQTLGPEVGTAAVGVAQGPLAVQTQWIVWSVSQRSVPKLDDIRDQLEQGLSGGSARKALDKVLKETPVKVDPRYGRWDAKQAVVVAPGTPTTTTGVPATAGQGAPGS